ncbi:HNH endonuclease [Halomicrobium salinisoli]|uniref:HNH endonuclease n=1 Tax=Halomicrobium salinisoli TaxID=2878391 RepID=UPI001CEFB9CB|nr:HNH endonuclease [Halomicrobium salinisoli]
MAVPVKIKKEIYERDNHCCQRCGTKEHPYNLHAHHITPKAADGEARSENLVTLCEVCHERLHRYNESMSDVPDRGLTAFTLPNASLNDYVASLDEHLDGNGICIPVHIREALYVVISLKGKEMSQTVNCWRVDLQPDQDDTFGICDCPLDEVCRHLVEAHLIDPWVISDSQEWKAHAVDLGEGSCWAPLCITDFIDEVPRYPKVPFESRLTNIAEPIQLPEY